MRSERLTRAGTARISSAYKVIRELLEEDEETILQDDQPFDPQRIPGCSDGDWLPLQEMLRWIPRNIQVAYEKRSFSIVSGDGLMNRLAADSPDQQAVLSSRHSGHGSWVKGSGDDLCEAIARLRNGLSCHN